MSPFQPLIILTLHILNPFNSTTMIEYGLPFIGHVKLEIWNILGQKVTTLIDESKSAGNYQVVWKGCADNGKELGTGIYLMTIRSGEFRKTMKMLLIK